MWPQCSATARPSSTASRCAALAVGLVDRLIPSPLDTAALRCHLSPLHFAATQLIPHARALPLSLVRAPAAGRGRLAAQESARAHHRARQREQRGGEPLGCSAFPRRWRGRGRAQAVMWGERERGGLAFEFALGGEAVCLVWARGARRIISGLPASQLRPTFMTCAQQQHGLISGRACKWRARQSPSDSRTHGPRQPHRSARATDPIPASHPARSVCVCVARRASRLLQSLVGELLAYLPVVESEYKEDLVTKICRCAARARPPPPDRLRRPAPPCAAGAAGRARLGALPPGACRALSPCSLSGVRVTACRSCRRPLVAPRPPPRPPPPSALRQPVPAAAALSRATRPRSSGASTRSSRRSRWWARCSPARCGFLRGSQRFVGWPRDALRRRAGCAVVMSARCARALAAPPDPSPPSARLPPTRLSPRDPPPRRLPPPSARAQSGAYVSDELASSLVSLISKSPEIQAYTTSKLHAALSADLHTVAQTLVQARAAPLARLLRAWRVGCPPCL